MALTDKLTAIGDAIRSKTGGSDLLTLDEMPQEIQSIQTGGGGGGTDTALADSIVDGSATSFQSDTVTKVAPHKFYDDDNITELIIPNATEIGNFAFYESKFIQTVDLSGAVSIGGSAFRHNISFGGGLNLPNVETLGSSCFYQWINLYYADLGKPTSIPGSCFALCTSFEYIIIRSSELCTLASTSAFSSTDIASGTGYIYVPQALIEQYKVATNWATYANQFRAIEDYPEICGEVS